MAKVKKNYNDLLSVLIVLIVTLAPSISLEAFGDIQLNKYFNLEFIIIYFFSFNRFKYFRVISLFVLGIIVDSLIGNYLGISSIAFLILYKIAIYQNTIQVRSIFISEWIAFGLAIFVVYVVELVMFYLTGVKTDIQAFVLNFIGSFLSYPIFWIILKYSFLRLERFSNDKDE